MKKRKVTPEQQARRDRLEARAKILSKANEVCRQESGASLDPYRMRHIDRAVRACRHGRLVKGDVLVAAGFNPS